MNNISFGGKTDFIVSPNAYKKVANSTRIACTNLHIGHDCKLNKHKLCTIKTDPENITVIMKSKHDGFFKYVPIGETAQKVINDISAKMEKLQNSDKGESLTAWILGGTKIEGKHGSKVIQTLNKIADLICDKPNIDTSILVGSKTGEEMFVVRANVNKFRVALDKKINPKNSIDTELEKIFDIVELNNAKLSYIA